MKYTILSENISGSAITNLTEDIFKALQDQLHEVQVVYKLSDLPKQCGILVNLLPKQLPKIHYQKRFVKIDKIYTVFTPNFIEFEEHDLIQILFLGKKYNFICPSETSYNDFDNFCLNNFSMELYKSIMDNTEMSFFGIKDIFKDINSNKKTKFIVPFTRVNETQKKITVQSKITSQIKKLIPESTHTFMCNPFFGKEKEHTFGYDEVIETIEDQNTLAGFVQEYGFFISTSKTESFGLFYLELIKSGVIGIFVDHEWVDRILPDYPFVCAEKDVVNTVNKLYNDYDSSKKKLADFQKYISDNYSWSKFIKSLN